MKKNFILVVLGFLLLSPSFGFAQINFCNIQMNSFGASECGSTCYNGMAVEDIANMPLVYFNVDFHFIRSGGNQFQCSDPNLPYYAPAYVHALLNFANDYFANPAQNQFGTSPALIDTRFRYRLHGSPIDPCDAIFLHDQDPQSFTNSTAMHIVIKGCGGTITGQLYAGNIMAMYDIFSLAFDQGLSPQSIGEARGSTINHEMGHRFGLCHAFSEDNVCPDMDPGSECGSPSETLCSSGEPCPTTQGSFTCGGDNCWKCFCTYGIGNNFMGYTNNRRGIARSQWAQMYTTATTDLPSFVTVDNAQTCPEIPPHLPLVIPSGTIVEWNNLRIINQSVEVQTGATLIIRCEVRMGKELPIVVKQGARLFVIGGTITSQSPNCQWGGIFVHGNPSKEQPTVLDAQEPNILLAPDDAGVVWLVGAILKNAVTAISTKASGNTDDHALYGGLVMVNASDFVDNGRAVQFMKYEKVNKSYFNFVDIVKSGTPPWPVNRGISIWGCRDIHIDTVNIIGISDYGILGINFSAKLKACTFEGTGNVGYGFKQESTMPNVLNSLTEIEGCRFSRHKYSIWCNSTPNMIYGLRVDDNQFFNPLNAPLSIPFRIRIAGESSFRIESDNFFQQGNISILASSTGSIINGIHCNIFESFTNSGIKTEHNNKNLEIFGNDFLNLSGTEINVSGSIAPLQGTGGKSAGNCFSNPVGAIFANPNNTVPFRYYVHNLNNNPVFCEKPTNNLSDTGTNNYTLNLSADPYSLCDPQATPEDFTESDLNTARLLTATQKALWLADSQNLQKFEAYWLAEKEQ